MDPTTSFHLVTQLTSHHTIMFLFLRPKTPFPIPFPFLTIPLRCLSNPNPNPNPNLTSSSYDDLITQAGHSRDFPTVQSLLTQRIRAGYFNTTNTFKFVSQDPSSFLTPTIQAISSLDHPFGQKNAFDSLIAHLCKSHHIDHARHVLDGMLHSNHSPNVISFYPILSFLTRKKQMAEVNTTLSFMKQHSIPPDATCFNYIICAYCHVGNVSAAAETLEAMLRDGLVPDSLTFDGLVIGACRVGRLDAAVGLVRRMVEDGVKVLYCTYAHVISGLLGVGAYGEAVEFVRVVGGRERRLDGENFGVLGRGLVRRKRWEEVRVVLREMEMRGLEFDGMLKDVHECGPPTISDECGPT